MKKRLLCMAILVMLVMSAFAGTALASDDEVTITGTIREADGTPAEKGKYVISITTDKLVCVSGTDGFITLVPQLMDEAHVIKVKENNVEVASAEVTLSRGDEYSFTATDKGAEIIILNGQDKLNFDLVVDGDTLKIEEQGSADTGADTAEGAEGEKKSSGALLYLLIAAVVIIAVVVIILISKKNKNKKDE